MPECSVHGTNNTHSTEECRVLLAKLSVSKKREQMRAKKKAEEETNTQKDQQTKETSNDSPKNTDSSNTNTKSPVSTSASQKRKQWKNKKNHNKNKTKPKNTTNFTPSFAPPDLRLKFYVPSDVGEVLTDQLTVHDVCYVPSLFCAEKDSTVYEKILKEVKSSSSKKDELFVEWHGDSHVIANDKVGEDWKAKCPTIISVLKKMETFFDFTANATRVNWYRPESEDWKPYHHDRAAFTPGEPQNFTIAASFGCTREVGFEHAKKGTKIFFDAGNGSAYTFCRDVNIEWKHGIIATKEKQNIGRISIIAWGLRKQSAALSRVTTNDVPTAEDLGL